MSQTWFRLCRKLIMTIAVALVVCLPIGAQVSEEILESISTPDQIETSIGTLRFLDGAPYPDTSTAMKKKPAASLHTIVPMMP